MISSHKAVGPRRLHAPSTRAAISSHCPTSLHPSTSSSTHQISNCRSFSWGAKHKVGQKNAGKVWKGFSTQDHTRARKQLYRGTFWNHHYGPYLRQSFPVREWRLSSSWGKPAQAPKPKTKAEEKAEEDWYSRYQVQKKRQYEDFMKRMEEDPIGMLFGTRWAKCVDSLEPKAAQSSASDAEGEPSTSKNGKFIWDWGYCPKPDKETEANNKQSQSSVDTAQSLDQEYEIDPITNRKVRKMAATLKTSVQPDSSSTKGTSAKAASTSRNITQDTQRSVDIPVKRFRPSDASSQSNPTSDSSGTMLGAERGNQRTSERQNASGWLAQEGFGRKQESISCDQPALEKENENPEQAPSKIESALDRHVESKASTKVSSKIESALDRHLQTKKSYVPEPDRETLQYRDDESKQEDLDLLRPSDVRASAGLKGRPAKENEASKQARQRKLEEEYDSGPLRRDDQLAQEVAKRSCAPALGKDAAIGQKSIAGSASAPEEPPKPKENINISDFPSTGWTNEVAEPRKPEVSTDVGKSTLQVSTSEKANKIKTQIVPLKARLDSIKAEYDALRQQWLDEKRKHEEKVAKKIKVMHEAEIKAQKVAMQQMETRRIERTGNSSSTERCRAGDNVSNNASHRLQSFMPGEGDVASNVHEFAGRDRWYKKKAPHANDEMNTRVQRLTNDRALIREVRDIYEETYGTIDTKHRQPDLSETVKKPCNTTSSETPKLASADSNSVQSFPTATRSPLQQVNSPQTSSRVQAPEHPASSDRLTVIQRLFDALRQAQAFVQEHRTDLQQVSEPSASQLRNSSESTDALVIIQKLFSELRQAQAVIQDQRANPDQSAYAGESAAVLQSSKAFKQSVQGMMKTASKLATAGQDHSSEMMDSSSTTPEPKNAKFKDPKSLNLYRILALDPSKQKVVASKATSLAPFSKEKPLLPVEALEILDNPGNFLPDLLNMHKKGYTVVFGNRNTLVFKKSATASEIEEAEREEIVKDVNPVDLMGTEHYLFGTSSPSLPHHEVKSIRDMEEKAHKDPITSTSASSAASETTTEELDTPVPSPSTSESNLPPSEKVRREEAVFSGPSYGNWQDAESKRFNKKHKRSVKRSRKFKNMFVTGTVTAACCYAVGVISQMMQ